MATVFALKPSRYVWEAIADVRRIDAVVDRLRARLGDGADVERDGTAVLVRGVDGTDALAIERMASAEPYVVGGELVFTPLPCAAGPDETSAKRACDDARRIWAALVWGGSWEATRLVLFQGQARIGGDDSCEIRVDGVDRAVAIVEQRGHHIYCGPLDTAPPADLRFHGEPLERRRFHGPKLLLVDSRSLVVLLDGASDAARFRDDWVWDQDRTGRDLFADALLAIAAARGVSFGALVVRAGEGAPLREWREAFERELAWPAARRRIVSVAEDRLTIVIEAPPDDLAVHADAVREHFGDRDVTIAELTSPAATPSSS